MRTGTINILYFYLNSVLYLIIFVVTFVNILIIKLDDILILNSNAEGAGRDYLFAVSILENYVFFINLEKSGCVAFMLGGSIK